jgi:hypothetical protein
MRTTPEQSRAEQIRKERKEGGKKISKKSRREERRRATNKTQTFLICFL